MDEPGEGVEGAVNDGARLEAAARTLFAARCPGWDLVTADWWVADVTGVVVSPHLAPRERAGHIFEAIVAIEGLARHH